MIAPSQHTNTVTREDARPGELPDGWVQTTLQSVTSPRGLKVKPSNMPDAPFVGLEHIEAHSMKLLGMGRTHDVKSAGSYFVPGDVLYGRLRPYLNKVYMPDFEGLASGEFIVFKEHPFLDNAYLKYFLNQMEFATYATRLNTGDRPRVDFSQLGDYPFALAPLAEQRRIVAEIEKQFTRLDASLTTLRRVQANLKRHRSSVLKAACEGKLVPTEAVLARNEGRDYESADLLLERILAERRAHWESQDRRSGKFKYPTPLDTSNLPDLPEGWVWVELSALAKNMDALRVPIKAKDRAEMQGRYPYYGASGVIDSVDGYLFDGTFLLIAEDGANLLSRSTPIAFVAHGQFWVNNHAHVLKLIGHLSIGYLEAYVNSLNLQQYVTGTAQPKLTQSALNRIPVPLPPLAEQRRIVAEIQRRLSVVEQTEVSVETNRTRTERLRQSILKQAFSGKLVSQDPADEPASELLGRIRSERYEAQGSKLKGRGQRQQGRPNTDMQLVLGVQEGDS